MAADIISATRDALIEYGIDVPSTDDLVEESTIVLPPWGQLISRGTKSIQGLNAKRSRIINS